jgi:large subunit ribosomal protein L27
MASHGSTGSIGNGRTSNNPRYRGFKKFGSEKVKAGNIILRQKGNLFYPGDNVGQGRDFTIYTKIDGIVSFSKKNNRKYINVYNNI